MMNLYEYWKKTFFLADGTPRYYDHKTLPLDIQCSSQAIDTLVFFHDRDPESLPLALKVAQWTITTCKIAPAISTTGDIRHGLSTKPPHCTGGRRRCSAPWLDSTNC
jgi:hypothetical protein